MLYYSYQIDGRLRLGLHKAPTWWRSRKRIHQRTMYFLYQEWLSHCLGSSSRLGFKTCLSKTKTKTKTLRFQDQDRDQDL